MKKTLAIFVVFIIILLFVSGCVIGENNISTNDETKSTESSIVEQTNNTDIMEINSPTEKQSEKSTEETIAVPTEEIITDPTEPNTESPTEMNTINQMETENMDPTEGPISDPPTEAKDNPADISNENDISYLLQNYLVEEYNGRVILEKYKKEGDILAIDLSCTGGLSRFKIDYAIQCERFFRNIEKANNKDLYREIAFCFIDKSNNSQEEYVLIRNDAINNIKEEIVKAGVEIEDVFSDGYRLFIEIPSVEQVNNSEDDYNRVCLIRRICFLNGSENDFDKVVTIVRNSNGTIIAKGVRKMPWPSIRRKAKNLDDLSSLGEFITKEISMVDSYSLVDYDINGGEGLESVSVTLSCSNINDFSRLNGISFYLRILDFTKDNYDVSRCILKVKEASTGKTMLYLIGDDDVQFYGFIIASGLEPPHGPVIYETDYDVDLY